MVLASLNFTDKIVLLCLYLTIILKQLPIFKPLLFLIFILVVVSLP